jgi:hypothetical protein
MACDTPSSPGGDSDICAFNLPCNHAYTLISATQVALTNSSIYKLYQIRNPWRKESQKSGNITFNGKFCDNCTVWNDE